MLRYKLFLGLLFIPLTLYTLWQSFRAGEFRYFLQRMGLSFPQAGCRHATWFHAASVGEVNAVIPLILKIYDSSPSQPIILTSNTPTSYQQVKKQLGDKVSHFYFPLDYKFFTYRLIKKLKPTNVFVVETELWPNFFTNLHRLSVPFYIINGRVSEKTLYTKDWLKAVYKQILSLVNKVYARSETDAERYIELGVNPRDVEILGNIKFSSVDHNDIDPVDLGREYVLVASTRDNEEKLIVDAWLKSEHGNRLLVIVPRHIQRLNDILNDLKPLKLEIAVRSKNDPVSASTQVYIADTMGELRQFIKGSLFTIMGGSFVSKGGQNIIEVAQMGKAVIYGPDMRNFEDEAKIFLEYKAGVQCELSELSVKLNNFHTDINYLQSIENNAMRLISDNKNIEKYLDTISKLIN